MEDDEVRLAGASVWEEFALKFMDLASRIRRNSLFSLSSSVVRLATNVLLFVGIARFFGSEGLGQFATAQTLAALFLLVADFGLDVLLTTEIARDRSRSLEIARQFLGFKVLFCALAFTAMWVVPHVQELSRESKILILILSFHVFFTALTNFFFALFKGFEELQHETKVSLVINSVLLVSLVVLGIARAPLENVALVFVGTRVIGLGIAVWIARRFLRIRSLSISFRGWNKALGITLIFGLHLFFGSLYFQLDTLLLAFWRGDHEVGIYQAVFKLVTLILVLPDVAVNALMPVLSRIHGEDTDRWRSLGALLKRFLFFVALPIALILFIYPEQIIQILYGGSEFEAAAPILRIFALIVLIRFAAETDALMLTTSRRQAVRMLIVMAGTAVNFVGNSFAIPRYGALGAAVISLGTNFLVASAYVLTSRMSPSKGFLELRNLIPLAFTVVMGSILWNFASVSVWIAGPFIVFTLAIVGFTTGFTQAERNLILAVKNETSRV